MINKKRKLAAIMFTDIVGYSAMMQENEAVAADMRQRHRDIFQKEHQTYFGELLQYYGDGTLSVFESAVEAVKCAIAMQQIFQTGEAIPLRIGIHLGDIVFDENEVYGDGVNLASRIEGLGVPGCILISDKLYFAVKNHDSISVRSVGHFEFKNIKEPIEVFAITNSGIRIPKRDELKGKLKENKKSIAVLPFVNLSSDPENEYFSDGISEEILNALVKVEGLQVTARTSSFSFKGKNMDVREIGRLLNVSHILEGSVRKAGNRVRITAQLVSGMDGYHFFSEKYDRTLEDIFAVQDEIAQKITYRLRSHLGEAQRQQQLVNAPTLNMKAYETYLKGLYYSNQFSEEAFTNAIPYFEEAINLQNDFALPHTKLGLCYLFQAFGGKMTWTEAYKKAMTHIDRTIELQVESPEVYFTLMTFQFFFKWDWEAAFQATRKGLEVFPNAAQLYHAYSTLYYVNGDHAKAIEVHKKGLQLDPLSIEMMLYMGICYLWSGDNHQAHSYIEKVLEMVPNHRTALEIKGWIAAREGRLEDALALFEKLKPATGYRLHRYTCLAWIHYKMGEKDKAVKYLQDLLLLDKQSGQNIIFTLDLATVYTCFGDFDKAFHYLEKAITNKIGDSMMLRSDTWFLAPLRSDARFEKMEALIGEMPSIEI